MKLRYLLYRKRKNKLSIYVQLYKYIKTYIDMKYLQKKGTSQIQKNKTEIKKIGTLRERNGGILVKSGNSGRHG